MNLFDDPVYQTSVKPFMWICAAILPSAYIIGLLFSLHTHADMVWKSSNALTKPHEAPHPRSYPIAIIHPNHAINEQTPLNAAGPPILRAVVSHSPSEPVHAPIAFVHAKEPEEEEEEEAAAGHDSPNWGKSKSYTVLFGCTLLYAIIAEILVETVDLVMEGDIDEKFLGLTLFALVPNITEFMNAISFALHGNIVLSMEIGSAYALQVCLLQIPAMVAFSLWYNWGKEEIRKFTFT